MLGQLEGKWVGGRGSFTDFLVFHSHAGEEAVTIRRGAVNEVGYGRCGVVNYSVSVCLAPSLRLHFTCRSKLRKLLMTTRAGKMQVSSWESLNDAALVE